MGDLDSGDLWRARAAACFREPVASPRSPRRDERAAMAAKSPRRAKTSANF
jgi:hypothetical protein